MVQNLRDLDLGKDGIVLLCSKCKLFARLQVQYQYRTSQSQKYRCNFGWNLFKYS